MLSLVLEGLFWLFAIFGIACCLIEIKKWLMQKKSEGVTIRAVVTIQDEETAQAVLMQLRESLFNINSGQTSPDIYIIGDELQGDISKIAKTLSNDFNDICICKKKDIPKIFEVT